MAGQKKNKLKKYAVARFAGLCVAVVSVLALVAVAVFVKSIRSEESDSLSEHSLSETPIESNESERETEDGSESGSSDESIPESESESALSTEIRSETETELPTESETETELPTESVPRETTVVVPPETPAVVPTVVPPQEPAVTGEYYGLRSLTAEEMYAISSSYDQTGRGYGSGLAPSKDGYGRPAHNASLDASFKSLSLPATFFCAEPGVKKVSFMFMEGTETGYTSQVLDILRDKNVKGSFFVTHFYAASWPGLISRMISEGHELGSHTYASPGGGIVGKPFAEQLDDALRMQRYIGDTFGYAMQRYNFNDGVYETATVAALAKMGYKAVVFGSVQYDDWNRQKTFDVNDTLAKLKAALHDGCIYSFHSTNVITVQVLPELIDYARAMGYEIVGLP